MKDKVCLITGSNTGIGKETALGLAKQGAIIVMLCRDLTRGKHAMLDIIEKSNNNSVSLMICDLSSQKDILKFANKFKNKYKRLDVLINNAGIIPLNIEITKDGIEKTFAVNHMAPFLLTKLLLDLLISSSPSRIINVSSDINKYSSIDFHNLQGEKSFSPMEIYGQTKIANILFTYELHRRLIGKGVTVNCLHPGFVATNIVQKSPYLNNAMKMFKNSLLTPEQGAETSIYLASDPSLENVSGKYFENKKETSSSHVTYDLNSSKLLWEISESLIKV